MSVQRFMEVYAEVLPLLRKEKPELYVWPESETSTVLAKMGVAFEKGTFNHDGEGIKRACKILGIKHTRKAMLEFFKEGK
jgi:hypothetical protein